MASDVAPSPTLFEILLGSSPHVRGVVFSECSVLELARFSCASRVARKMSLTEMGRRKLDVTVRMEKLIAMNRSTWVEKTLLTIKDRFGPTAKMQGPVFHCNFQDPNGTTIAHRKFATILYTLLAHSRIRNLEFEWDGEPAFHFIVLFLRSGLLDDRIEHFEAIGFPGKVNAMPLEQPFNVEFFRVPDYWPCMLLFDVISARRFIVTRFYDETYYGIHQRQNIYSYRGMLHAEHVEVDPFLSRKKVSWNVETHLQHLMAPNINLHECVIIKEHDVHAFIRQWQAGQRTIETFHAKLLMTDDADNKSKGFARIMNSIANSSEVPYPSQDVIPSSVRLQMEKTEKFYATTDKEPRAFVIGRDLDECCLVVLAKILVSRRVAVGIFQKQ